MTTRQIIHFFIQYKYQAIFPIAFLEGPIITIISGVLVSRGHLALIPTLLIVFFGDFLSDIVFYMIGRGGRHVLGYLKFIHITPEQLEKLEKRYHSHPWKTMIVSKVSYGLGTAFMIGSGASHMSPRDFLGYMSSLNFVRSSVLLAIGYYFGKTAIKLGPTYLWYYGLVVIIFVPILYLIFRKKYFTS